LETRQQATDRIHRIGQKSVCQYIDIIIENTIDEKILSVLKKNKKVADEIIDGKLKSFITGKE
jgi:SNF2 family DNA or RNA helicase